MTLMTECLKREIRMHTIKHTITNMVTINTSQISPTLVVDIQRLQHDIDELFYKIGFTSYTLHNNHLLISRSPDICNPIRRLYRAFLCVYVYISKSTARRLRVNFVSSLAW